MVSLIINTNYIMYNPFINACVKGNLEEAIYI